MKQLIVFVGLTALGIAIYTLIAGPDDSVKTALKEVWEYEINRQATIYP